MDLTGAKDVTGVDEPDLVRLDRIAVHESVRLVGLAEEKDWERDTPCAEWPLRRLVAHMAAQHHGFAAAARGAGADMAHWREPEEMSDPERTYRGAAMGVLAAFGQPGVLQRKFALPELGVVVPGRIALGFHLVDYVAHAWDVAAALGVEPELPTDVLDAALGVALLVPTDPAGRGPGFAFAPPLAVPPGTGSLDATLRLLGRDPDQWFLPKDQRNLPSV
ncbi:TIGR03086 family metal-binding protein [Streptomyces yaanensis]|uniref:TIGR03086 family metal-binding protein n=1 Tax=Streptomyces yaanensis TaxID=1142239 RepID=A0ABV7SCP1_9ACTN|nr:TIGR03086 family metal-binding protein [Streptomyces sp. CGMCC 4.7035]WNB98473.1 TIGR03086 family metal-binding protein [Streptomyces sp. CGMCC 4.7035]